jgi:hypothetical protein
MQNVFYAECHKQAQDAGCHYAECLMLSVVMLSVIMLSVVMQCVIMLNDVAPIRYWVECYKNSKVRLASLC